MRKAHGRDRDDALLVVADFCSLSSFFQRCKPILIVVRLTLVVPELTRSFQEETIDKGIGGDRNEGNKENKIHHC